MNSFEQLIQPLATDTFFNEYWEKQPLHITRERANYYSALFSIKDVDDVICFTEPQFPAIQIFNQGKPVPWNFFSESAGMSNINALYAEYQRGTTLILRGLQHRWQPVANLYRNLESYFNHLIHINLYLTPKNAQGFASHFDTHEVFILQVEGSKHWRIYDTFEDLTLPIEQRSLPENKLQKPLHEIHLQAGELLYIPSGYVHEALTSESSSIHLTVGINAYRWSDLLRTAITLVAEENEVLRKSLPIGFLEDSHQETIEQRFPELLNLLLEDSNLEAAVERLSKDVFRDFPPLPDGHFAQLDALEAIAIDTVVKKRHGGLCRIFSESESDSVSIHFPGNKVVGPKSIEPSLQFIADAREFSVDSLPDSLSDNSKLVLVRRLVKEGLLTSV